MSTERTTFRLERPPVQARDHWFMVLLTLFEVGASILIVDGVSAAGGSDFSAYMWSLIPPVVGAIVYWARTQHASGASFAILAFNGFSAALAFFGSHDSRVLLYKDCVVTGLTGTAFAVSLLLHRPLTYWFGQRFLTGGTADGIAWWDDLWRASRFRRMLRFLSALWAVILLAEAVGKAFAIAHTNFQDGYTATQIIPGVATVIGAAITALVVRHMAEPS